MRALLISLLLTSSVAHARDVWTVGPGGDAATIGGAVTLASSGDLILVEPGTYSECVVVPVAKALTISSTGSSDDTTINCGGLSQFAVDGRAALTLSGFTVRNVSQGIRMVSTATLSDVVVTGTTAPSGNGGCLVATNATLTVEASAFLGCTSTNGNGGAIALNGGTLDLLDVEIDRPTAREGGAIFAQNASVTATRLAITDPTATVGNGGGVLLTSTTSGNTAFTCTECDVSGGRAIEGGAVYAASAAITLVRSTFAGNEADDAAGALHSGKSLVARDTAFQSSTSGGPAGALDLTGDALLVGCTLSGSTSRGDGGAVRFNGGGVFESQDSVYAFNTAVDGDGGAIFGAGTVVVTHDAFTSNAAGFSGGALYAFDAQVAYSDLVGNTAVHGGGIYALGGAMRGSLLQDGFANGAGAGLYASGTYAITDSVITGNDASGSGGGIYFSVGNARLDIQSSDIVGNTSQGDGGGLFASAPGSGVTLISTLVADNTAVAGGGGVAAFNQVGLEVESSWFVGNTVTSTGNRGGGAISGDNMGALSLTTTVVCRNSSATVGGAVSLVASRSARLVNSTVFVENTASGPGGAWHENGVVNLAPAVPPAAFSQVTFVGNDGNNADGTVTVTPTSGVAARQSFSKAVFQSNGGVAVTTLPGASNTVTINDSWFADHTVAVQGPFSGTNNILSMSPKPIAGGTGSWTAFDGDCFNDVLVALDASSATNGASLRSDLYSDDTRSGADGDGQSMAAGDCAPYDPKRSGLLTETPGDSVDEDCHLGADADADADGYWATAYGGSDCNDGDAGTHPGAFDIAGDGLDQDCYLLPSDDGDGDGRDLPGDCDDTDPRVHAGAVERHYDEVEDACSGFDGDADRDGYVTTAMGGLDCQDFRDAISPGATEVYYDGIDQNCDGLSDFDADGDGDDCDPIVTGCPGLSGDDCDDTNPLVGPSQAEIYYDGFDGNCDGLSDFDADGDGYDCDGLVQSCGAGGGPDCDDSDANVYPGRDETYDGKDSDCDGVGDVDTDSDGILDYWEDRFLAQGMRKDLADSDQDGIPDGIEWGPVENQPADTDDDGQLDAAELESDGDTVPDAIEGAEDTDDDGILDFRDPDDDNDGVPTEDEVEAGGVPRDTDGDGLSDHRDPDSDNDGVLDGAEFGLDANENGVPDHLDNAADGVPTPSEPSRRGLGCDTSPGAPPTALGVLLLAVAIRRRR